MGNRPGPVKTVKPVTRARPDARGAARPYDDAVPRPPRPRPIAVILVSLALVATGCSGFTRSGTPIQTLPPVDYGEDLEFTPRPTLKKGKGTLVIFALEEGTNRPIAGAKVDYSGPVEGTMVTNARGRAAAKVKPGVYNVTLPPCGERVLITTFAEAGVGVVSGTKAGGPLFTTWEHRFVPTPSVRSTPDPPWKKGEHVTLGVRVEDRCTFTDAPGANLDGAFAWSSSTNFAFVETPSLRAGSDGFIDITVTCRKKGDGDITIFNRFDPEDEINLLLATSAPPPGETFCS